MLYKLPICFVRQVLRLKTTILVAFTSVEPLQAATQAKKPNQGRHSTTSTVLTCLHCARSNKSKPLRRLPKKRRKKHYSDEGETFCLICLTGNSTAVESQKLHTCIEYKNEVHLKYVNITTSYLNYQYCDPD